MSIANYTELQTAVANWLDRDDLAARIPEFISLCEARFNRTLRLRAMETLDTTVSTVGGTSTIALPTGYVQMRDFHLTTSPLTQLQYLAPEMMVRLNAGSLQGKPLTYTIIADTIRLGPTPDSAYTTSMLYYKTFDALSGIAPTNWVITNAPDVYLYGTLLEAEPFLMNDARTQLWAQALKESINTLQEQDNKDRHSGSVLRVMNTGGYY
jgi:hypothetical protein|tara:strand:- start:446 stop:1075 length:630 start_codon:yes stop_codon:yes gene_type:complete